MASSKGTIRSLILADLGEGWPKLTTAMGQTLAEAASVCLSSQNHLDGVELKVSGAFKTTYHLRWLSVTEQMESTHNDLQDATELGACGVALLLIRDLTEYTVVKKAWKGGGFDYWLGLKTDPLFQEKARLEVSGILRGKASTLQARVQQKRRQVMPSDYLQLPAYIVVVAFDKPTARVEVT